MSEKIIQELKDRAFETRRNAFVPRSGHKIGVALLTSQDHIFTGCNIESNISGLGACAERVAVDNSITNGEYTFKALLVLDNELTVPCGACLQYLAEFYAISNHDIDIIMCDEQGNTKMHSLLTLLPQPYLSTHDLDKLREYKV